MELGVWSICWFNRVHWNCPFVVCLGHNVDLSECRPFHNINLKSVIWFFTFNYTGSRKRSWQNHAKAHPVDQKQNAVVIQRGPPPRPDSGPRFAPQAVGRPFMDHFTSGAQQFGIRPMAPPGGGPAGRFSRRGPPSGGPLYMVPPHTRQFQRRPPEGSSLQGNYPVRQPSGFTLRHCLPPRQGFSGPLSGGPSFQGPWQVSAPSGFPSQHPMPQGFPEPCFQGQNYIGMHPRPPWPHNLWALSCGNPLCKNKCVV